MTIANLINMIANITARELDLTREEIEKPYAASENAAEARAVIAKVAVAFGVPLSAIRRAIKRNENLTMYYLAHEARESVVREVKRQTQYFLDQLDGKDSPPPAREATPGAEGSGGSHTGSKKTNGPA